MGLVLVDAFSGFTLISIYVEKLYSINQPSTQPVTAYIETADFGLQTDYFVVVMLPWKLCRAFQVQIFHLELTFEHTIIITQTQISTISTVILEIDNHVLVNI